MKRLLIGGSTSTLGRHLVSILVKRGYSLTLLLRAPDRQPPPPAGVTYVRGDVLKPETLPAACDGIHTVISAIGAPLLPRRGASPGTFETIDHLGNAALARAAATAGARRMVYVSVAGDYPSGLGYVDAHRNAEAAIAKAGLEPRIVRATGFQGTLTGLVDLARAGVLPLPGHGTVRTNPIAEVDLAEAVADAVEGRDPLVEVGGPEVLSRREILETAFDALGRTPRIVSIPTGALRLGAGLLGPLHRRYADLSAFFSHLHDHDAVAPTRGRVRLRDTFDAHVASSRG